jgi:hypothetical protein
MADLGPRLDRDVVPFGGSREGGPTDEVAELSLGLVA